jgi:hypothetical protein
MLHPVLKIVAAVLFSSPAADRVTRLRLLTRLVWVTSG